MYGNFTTAHTHLAHTVFVLERSGRSARVAPVPAEQRLSAACDEAVVIDRVKGHAADEVVVVRFNDLCTCEKKKQLDESTDAMEPIT